MSALISCQSIAKSFGAQNLFASLDFRIEPDDRIGLIGPNGSGKSTLLKILAGLEDQDSGTIVRKKNLVTAYVAQEDRFHEENNAIDNLLQACATMAADEQEKLSRVQAILSRAELEDVEVPVKQLSGGWRKRLSICRACVGEPDLLVMDEPTNHLDIEGIVWLEKLLGGLPGVTQPAFILVSHDRRFLESSVNRIVELSPAYPGGSFQVGGTYSTFIEKRQEFIAQQSQQEERLANKVRRETEWLRRGPKARTSKARYRIDEAYRLQDELTRLQSHNRADKQISIDFSATGRKTKKLLEATGITKSYPGKPLFSGLDLTLSPGTRIGLVGQNGCGKSTLMHILASAEMDILHADTGTLRTAPGVSIVNFKQDRSSLDQDATLKRALAPEGDSIIYKNRPVHVVTWAKRFLFRPDQLETPVGQLSGGEQARILIAELMRQPADILLLDEPTNDLDINSRDVLEEGLTEFDGAVVLVTHDRYLLDRVCDHLLGFIGDGEIYWYGDYRQWFRDLSKKTVEAQPEAPVKNMKTADARQKRSGKLSYLDQREYEQMESRIEEAEAERDLLEQRIGEPELASDPVKLDEVWKELERAREQVEHLYERWDELEEKKNGG